MLVAGGRADGARRPGHGDHRPHRLPGAVPRQHRLPARPCRPGSARPAAARRGQRGRPRELRRRARRQVAGPRGAGDGRGSRQVADGCATPTSRSAAPAASSTRSSRRCPTLGTLAVLARRRPPGRVRQRSSAGDVVQVAYLFTVLAFPVRALGWVLGELPAQRRRLGPGRRGARGARRAGLRRPDAALAGHRRARARRRLLVDFADERGVDRPALHGVTFDVPAGPTVAVVGPTGSGKSTLTDLLVRLVDPHRRATCCSTASTCARSPAAGCRRGRPWCRSRRSCSTTPCAATSPSAADYTDDAGLGGAARWPQADRLRGRAAARPRHPGGRAGHLPVRWAAAADRAGPSGRPPPAAAGARRRHQRRRPRGRAGDPGRRCARRAPARPWSSSPTAWPPSRWPTRSSTSSTAGSSTTAPTRAARAVRRATGRSSPPTRVRRPSGRPSPRTRSRRIRRRARRPGGQPPANPSPTAAASSR